MNTLDKVRFLHAVGSKFSLNQEREALEIRENGQHFTVTWIQDEKKHLPTSKHFKFDYIADIRKIDGRLEKIYESGLAVFPLNDKNEEHRFFEIIKNKIDIAYKLNKL